MKTSLALILSLMMILTVACGGIQSSSGPSETSGNDQTPQQGSKFVIKINNDTAANTLKGESWLHFKETLESKIGDRVEVQIYDSGTLYNQSEQIQALQQNNIQMISPAPGVLTGQFPKLAVFGLPYLFKSPEMISEIIRDEEVTSNLFKELEEKNAKVISVWLNGWRMISAREPVNNLDELKDVKIRVPAGNNYVETFKALGANVVTINWSEVPISLQQGVIDAVEPTPNANYSDKIFEVAPYITKINYMLDIYVIVVNKQWLEDLPDDVRSAIVESIEQTQAWNWERTTKANEEAMTKMEEEGATFIQLTEEELARWQNATTPVLEMYKSEVGADLIDKIINISENFEWERP